MSPARSLRGIVVCALFHVSGLGALAHADDRLDKKIFLLGRALKNNDCQQALQMSDKLVAEYGEDASVYWARARSRACDGNFIDAWADMETYRRRGGADPGAEQTEAAIRAELYLVQLTISPKAVEVPDGFLEGVDVAVRDVRTGHVSRSGPGQYRVAFRPGTHTLSASHKSLPVSVQLPAIDAQAGVETELQVDMILQVGKLQVSVSPGEEAPHISVFWRPAGVAESAWTPLDREAGGFSAVVASQPVRLEIRSDKPRISRTQQDVVVAPGVVTTAQLRVESLPPATLQVGALDPTIEYWLTLPTGKVVAVAPNSVIETGAGIATFQSLGFAQSSGQLTILRGDSDLPLPRAIELDHPNWGSPLPLLVAPSATVDDVTGKVRVYGTSGPSFAITVPRVAPGELRRVALTPATVPALQAHAELRVAKQALVRSRKRMWVSGGATLLCAGVAEIAFISSRNAAEDARQLDEPSDLETYRKLSSRAASRAQVATVGMWAGFAGLGLTTTFTVQSLKSAETHRKAAAAFDAARKVPWTAPSTVGGGVGQ